MSPDPREGTPRVRSVSPDSSRGHREFEPFFYIYPMLPYYIGGYNENSLLITIDWPSRVEANIAIHRLSLWLQEQAASNIAQSIPAYHSLLIVVQEMEYLPVVQTLASAFLQIYQPIQQKTEEKPMIIPVCYHPELGNDLQTIAQYAGLSVPEVISIHNLTTYHIYMIGFLPGFPYMGDVDTRIAIPRKSQPVSTRCGAVGIAGIQTGIYPCNSPGGWHIVGYTPINLFNSQLSQPGLLAAGQQVKFEPIELSEYYAIKANHTVNR